MELTFTRQPEEQVSFTETVTLGDREIGTVKRSENGRWRAHFYASGVLSSLGFGDGDSRDEAIENALADMEQRINESLAGLRELQSAVNQPATA